MMIVYSHTRRKSGESTEQPLSAWLVPTAVASLTMQRLTYYLITACDTSEEASLVGHLRAKSAGCGANLTTVATDTVTPPCEWGELLGL